MAKGNFIEYVISDDPNKYPNESEQDGYYYRKVTKVETEEQTITAGTTPIEVIPSAGKLISKVNINPTPTEEKTVIPTTEDLIVTPVEGKQLSQVTVQGDANFIEENIAEGITMWGKTGTHQGGGGDVVNGIVESYLANSETIDANTFVEFIGSGEFGLINESATTISESSYSSYNIACTRLSNNKILVAHRYSDSSVYGSVVTINGSNIIVGEEVEICDKVPHYDGVYYGLTLTTIATDTAFMTITCYDDTTIYGLVIKVEGTNIIVGSIASIITNTQIYYYKVVRLSDNKIVIFHNTSTTGTQNSYLYGTCIEVNDTSFTKGTSYLIKNERTRTFDAVSLSESRMFVMHGDNSGAGIYKRYSIIDIIGTTISVSATGDWGNSIISSEDHSLKKMILLSNNRILVMNGHYDSNDSPNHSIYAEIVTVDNLTFTLNSAKKIILLDKSAQSINIIKYSDEEIFLTYSPYDSNDIHYARLSIAAYDVNVYSNDVLISGAYKQTNFAIYGIELVSYSKIFILYGISSSYSNLFGSLIGYDDIKISSSSNSIKGLTKTIATTTEPGEVWVLNKI